MKACSRIPSVLAVWMWMGAIGMLLAASDKGRPRVTKVQVDGSSEVNSQAVVGGGKGSVSGAVVGNGRRETRSIPVAASFHGLDLSGLFEAEVTCGGAAQVEVTLDENLFPLLKPSVADGVLSLRFTKPVQTKQSPVLKISMPSIDSLHLSGGDVVRVKNVLGKSLRLIHEGTGEVTLAGKVEAFTCKASGIGEIDAGRLSCQSAEVAVGGVGNVTCRPEAKLTASISGIGGVRCLTRPSAVEKQISGLGEVEFVGK